MDRRTWLQQLSALGLLSLSSGWKFMEDNLLQRPILGTSEWLPAVGVGTWQTFDVGDITPEREPLKAVLKTLVENGGSVIDSSPMYGQSEKVVGDLSSELNLASKLFVATKVWTRGEREGIAQMNQSFALLRRQKIDLMQIHNLVDWQTHLKTLRGWKEQGRVRYIGITHYTESAYDAMEQVMLREPLDFIQVNYSLLSRKAADRLFPLAQEKKISVLVNQPFEEGALFQRVKGKVPPLWAEEFNCHSWGQFFLKFILSHPAVTCVIPGTSKPQHMLDNLGAGLGRLPSEKQRDDMVKFINT
ncbi:aldo/keto reductase [Chryseolinea lacunae]|uniref:Aldo/keto reductase n=1 Tax=Chryseolinea lacunae TaxID=2801331 RepID=A0ABS1L166_9BACT|nr:aldo/keto reductase [Chryseolinea lacunae]MBL0745268.1 aldo/keto reductase [Chryseolinea lacunae]